MPKSVQQKMKIVKWIQLHSIKLRHIKLHQFAKLVIWLQLCENEAKESNPERINSMGLEVGFSPQSNEVGQNIMEIFPIYFTYEKMHKLRSDENLI